MFFHLLYIHLFRPFLKYKPSTSPLPAHVSPRKICTQAASQISKLMRLYKRTYGLRQICNIAVYIMHSACTIHLLNLPDKNAKRDIIHGVKHLEEIAEDWLCARRTLSILSVLARKWRIELPEEAQAVLARTDQKYGTFSTSDVPSPKSDSVYIQQTGLSFPVQPPHVQNPPVHSGHYGNSPDQHQHPVSGQPRAGNSGAGMFQNELANNIQVPPNFQQNVAPSIPPARDGLNSLPPDSAAQMAIPYSQRHNLGVSGTGTSGLVQAPNPSASSRNYTNQTNSGNMLGAVEALAEGQAWWLSDQASLAVGFDNWDQIGRNMGQNGVPNGTGVNGVNGTGATNGGYYIPDGGTDLSGYVEEDWYS